MTSIDARMIPGQRQPGAVETRGGAVPAGQVDARRPARPSGDTVTLSAAARALAATAAEAPTEADETLAPERVAEIRARILSGAYDSAEVAEEVARRLLESGEV